MITKLQDTPVHFNMSEGEERLEYLRSRHFKVARTLEQVLDPTIPPQPWSLNNVKSWENFFLKEVTKEVDKECKKMDPEEIKFELKKVETMRRLEDKELI